MYLLISSYLQSSLIVLILFCTLKNVLYFKEQLVVEPLLSKLVLCLIISTCIYQQEFSRAIHQSEPMKEFAVDLMAKVADTSSPRSSLLRNYSDVSLNEMGDDKCFTLTKALGYHVIHGRFLIPLVFTV